ncbi:PREDICTED: uncharacterized protein LOC109358020 [Lupinus angustifolius]|nr:PREDICTED: uncharacterized protein LOC109358020 [Lupinus angustifolius]
MVLATVTNSPKVVDKWISEIKPFSRDRLIVGLATETVCQGNPALATLQLCVWNRCLIFELNHCSKIPMSLILFLYDPNKLFVGVGVADNIRKLKDKYSLYVSNTVDLASVANSEPPLKPKKGMMNMTFLRFLAKMVLNWDINEKPTNIILSRWDNQSLSHEQIKYACADAFLSSEIARVWVKIIESYVRSKQN